LLIQSVISTTIETIGLDCDGVNKWPICSSAWVRIVPENHKRSRSAFLPKRLPKRAEVAGRVTTFHCPVRGVSMLAVTAFFFN